MTTNSPPARKNQKLLKSKMNFSREDLAELLDTDAPDSGFAVS